MKNNMQKIRWGLNMTLNELSKLTGIDASQLDRIENEETKDIYYSTACRIAKALNCSLEEVFPYN